jgi:hypothetical protein
MNERTNNKNQWPESAPVVKSGAAYWQAKWGEQLKEAGSYKAPSRKRRKLPPVTLPPDVISDAQRKIRKQQIEDHKKAQQLQKEWEANEAFKRRCIERALAAAKSPTGEQQQPSPGDRQGGITLGEAILIARFGKAARHPVCQTKIALTEAEEMMSDFEQKMEQLITLSKQFALLYQQAATLGDGDLALQAAVAHNKADGLALRHTEEITALNSRLLRLRRRFEAQLSVATPAARLALKRLKLEPDDSNLKARMLERLKDAVLYELSALSGKAVTWADIYRVLDWPLSDPVFKNKISPGDVAGPSASAAVRYNAVALGIELLRETEPEPEQQQPEQDALKKTLVRVGDGADEWNGDNMSFKRYCSGDDPPVRFDRHNREIEVDSRYWGHIGLSRKLRGLRYKKGTHSVN